MGTLRLVHHPGTPPLSVSSVEAAVIGLDENWLRLRWKVENAAAVLLPPFAGKGRADGLWRQTCFELFIQPVGGDADGEGEGGYVELNLSPSERWAAYDFAAYRSGMEDRPMPRDPDCTARSGRNILIFDASIPVATLPPLPWRLAISAVIEEQFSAQQGAGNELEEGVVKSLWALRHPPGEPDFHSPACFAASLAAPPAG